MYKLLILSFFFLLSLQSNGQDDLSILVFSKTNGFRHSAIDVGKEALEDMGNSNSWELTFSEDAKEFNKERLVGFSVVIFLNTTGDILNEKQQTAFENYINNGGGFVGIHSASDTEQEWPWFDEFLGAHFKNHPKIQNADIKVNKDIGHPSTMHLSEKMTLKDEWYNFKEPVKPHVNVLLSLDESSHKGGTMDGNHPISWYHHFEGGRVFYTGLGHTKEMYENDVFLKHIAGGIRWAAGQENTTLTTNWNNLLDKNLSRWDKYLGVPHVSVKGLGDTPKSENVHNGVALGLNNDPKEVFTAIEKDGDLLLKITGEIYGGLTSKESFKNYHFKAEFKWGDQKWEPRLDQKRDNGILYHCRGKHGNFWNVWKSSLECQVQETDCGDFIGLAGASGEVRLQEIVTQNGSKILQYDPKGEKKRATYVHKNELYEKPNGEWNTIEVLCLGTTSIHVVNGKVVNVIENATYTKPNGKTIPLSAGQIQIQSEAAETYYRNIQIRKIDDFPKKLKRQMRLK